MRKRATMSLAILGTTIGVAISAAPAGAHVHGITPLLTLANQCGVTNIANTGANRPRARRSLVSSRRTLGSRPSRPATAVSPRLSAARSKRTGGHGGDSETSGVLRAAMGTAVPPTHRAAGSELRHDRFRRCYHLMKAG